MSYKISSVMSFAILLIFSSSCIKDQALEQVKESPVVEVGVSKAPKWPRVKFKHHYDGMGSCSGGDCGRCIGICIYAPLSLGLMPNSTELSQGIGRVQVKVIGSNVEFMPLDQPMDPGTGSALLSDTLETSFDVAVSLGYSKVQLMPGSYTVNYGGGSTYGRILVPATLVP